MTTALTLITDAFLSLGEADASETLASADSALGLRVLNRLMDSWSQEGLMAFRFLEATQSTVVGIVAYLTSGFSPATRPTTQIEYAYLRDPSGIDSELLPITMAEYSLVSQKTVKARPDRYAIDGAYPAATINLVHAPERVYTITIGYRELMGTFTATSDALAQPPGYELAVVTNLARYLAPYYGIVPSADLIEQARESKANVKRNNLQRNKLRGDGALPVHSGSPFDINRG